MQPNAHNAQVRGVLPDTLAALVHAMHERGEVQAITSNVSRDCASVLLQDCMSPTLSPTPLRVLMHLFNLCDCVRHVDKVDRCELEKTHKINSRCVR